jgi:hypothetical protein
MSGTFYIVSRHDLATIKSMMREGSLREVAVFDSEVDADMAVSSWIDRTRVFKHRVQNVIAL